ncbi:hypothetical protein [Methylobacterium sp. J-090]|uniref:hypothetical protein n=1 Tax=Methylobacterium sp. J-090 TaxID=2836666 RepID=UPI001FBA7136|nr:hypothetical protein [Methylobacterium sp. J-090]MCJ2084354.1 hypothetical protein [Methylobacterium sp. J-090]
MPNTLPNTSRDEPRERRAQIAGAAFLVLAVLGAVCAATVYSSRIMVCHETNSYLTDQNYIDIMIANIVREGDHGGRAYGNGLDYLGDRTECCLIERITDRLPSGTPGKPEVSVSAKYFNTTRQDYVLIQRRFDACGHAASKPLTAG